MKTEYLLGLKYKIYTASTNIFSNTYSTRYNLSLPDLPLEIRKLGIIVLEVTY